MTFREGLLDFSAAVEGAFGDEGAQVEQALDGMTRALEEWDRAIRELEAQASADVIAGLRPRSFELRLSLARMYASRGRLADALREVDQANRVQPQRPEGHVLRGLIFERLERPVDAVEAFARAWALEPSDPVKAYDVLRRAAMLPAADVQRARDTLSAAYRRLLEDGAPPQAARFETTRIFRDDTTAMTMMPLVTYAPGYARILRSEFDAAMADFRTAVSADPLVSGPAARAPALAQAVGALREGRVAQARALLADAAVPESSETHRVRGLIDWVDSRYDDSVGHLAAAIRLNPRDERSRIALSRVLSSAGREQEAERVLLDALAVLPDSALARWWLARSYERTNRFAEARLELEHVVARAVTGRALLLSAIGRMALGAGDFAGAIEWFARAVGDNPNDPAAHRLLAGALVQQDRTEEALVEFAAALLIDPRDAAAHAGIGRIHLNAGRHDEAVAALRRAVALSPGDGDARYALAAALTRSGRTADAAEEFARVAEAQRAALAARRRTLSLDVLKEEAALRSAEGDHDRAVDLWQQVIAREPARASNHLALAGVLARAGDVERAIDQYERAAVLGADPVVFRLLADLYSNAGRTPDAARARVRYERALQEGAAR